MVGRIVWRREGKENEIIFFVSLQFGNAAGAGQFHFVFELAVETVDVQMTGDILEVGDEELATSDFGGFDDFRLFGNNLRPGGVGWIESGDTVIRRVEVCLDQEPASNVVNHVVGIVGDFGDDRLKGFIRFCEVAIENGVTALACSTIGNIQNGKTLVVGGANDVKALWMGFIFEHQFIL